MNRYGLIFNIILSLLVLLGSCNKSEVVSYTGLYNAQITISYSSGDKHIYDTTFQTLIIVNQVYGDQNIQLQWSLDNYFRIHGKKLLVPNTLTLKVNQPLFGYQKILSCKRSECYFFDKVNGQIIDNELKLNLESDIYPLRISIDAIKYQE